MLENAPKFVSDFNIFNGGGDSLIYIPIPLYVSSYLAFMCASIQMVVVHQNKRTVNNLLLLVHEII